MPAEVTVTELTGKPTVAVAVGFVEPPETLPVPPVILTAGADVYPLPPLVIVID